MSRLKQILRGNKGTLVLLVAACLLLASSALSSAQAALNIKSDTFNADIKIQNIGVVLNEKSAGGTESFKSSADGGISDSELLVGMLSETDGKFVVGKKYKEELSVTNTGDIDAYVRVRIYKSWTKEDGSKETGLAPSLIILNMTDNGWLIDQNASTEERTVLYWPHVLTKGKPTPALCDSFQIDNAITTKVTETLVTEGNLTTITTTFNYDGVWFNVSAEVDAVQTHNAADAIKSAWGVDVSVGSDGSLSLK